MIYKGKPYYNGWFGDTHYFRKHPYISLLAKASPHLGGVVFFFVAKRRIVPIGGPMIGPGPTIRIYINPQPWLWDCKTQDFYLPRLAFNSSSGGWSAKRFHCRKQAAKEIYFYFREIPYPLCPNTLDFGILWMCKRRLFLVQEICENKFVGYFGALELQESLTKTFECFIPKFHPPPEA